jgi:hypothetical protein
MFGQVLWRSRQLFSPPPSMRAGAHLRPPSIFYSSLNRRSQFTPEPARCFAGFHRIDQRDHALINVIAGTAFKCSDVKTRPTRGDPRQRCCCFALRTWWLVKRAHDAVPCIRRERDTLSHRVDARDGPVMEPACSRVRKLLVNTAHFKNNSQIQIEDNCSQMRHSAAARRYRPREPRLRGGVMVEGS